MAPYTTVSSRETKLEISCTRALNERSWLAPEPQLGALAHKERGHAQADADGLVELPSQLLQVGAAAEAAAATAAG